MMTVTKLVVLVFTLLGVSELGSQATFGKSPLCTFSKHAVMRAKRVVHHMRHHMSNFMDLHSEGDEDDHSHQRAWGEERLSHGQFHEKMRQKMAEVKSCHMGCGMDRECHMKCPKPWQKFQDKCDKLKPIFTCHKDCFAVRGGKQCHMKCPLPECPKMKAKMTKARECHMQCKDHDRSCHHQCPKPLRKLHHKCEALEEIHSCHSKCGMDFACHHACPKMEKLWHMKHHHRMGFLKDKIDGMFTKDKLVHM